MTSIAVVKIVDGLQEFSIEFHQVLYFTKSIKLGVSSVWKAIVHLKGALTIANEYGNKVVAEAVIVSAGIPDRILFFRQVEETVKPRS